MQRFKAPMTSSELPTAQDDGSRRWAPLTPEARTHLITHGFDLANRLDQLIAFGAGLGLDAATVRQVFEHANAEAQASTTWGTIEERLAEIRQRLIAVADEQEIGS